MLTRIINLSLAISEMPRELKCAMLRPLLKKAKADPKFCFNFPSVSDLKNVSDTLACVQTPPPLTKRGGGVCIQTGYTYLGLHQEVDILNLQ